MIGSGSFGHVYKAVKRIEGIFYAVKISKEKISKRTSHKMVQLNKEICALSVLGKSHQNLIRYYSSWIEEDRGNSDIFSLGIHGLGLANNPEILVSGKITRN